MRRASVRRHSTQQLRVSTITSAHSINDRLFTDLRLARFRQRRRGKHSETVREQADVLQVLVTDARGASSPPANQLWSHPRTFTLVSPNSFSWVLGFLIELADRRCP